MDKNEFLHKKYQILSEKQNSIKDECIKDISYYQKKININLVFIGIAHTGKSTSIGHLLYSTNNINSNDFQKLAKQSKEWGIYSFRYAWIMDKYKLERESTHTLITTSRKFETEKYFFSLVDIPGKKNLIKNEIKGIFQGDVAIIVVPADAIENIFSDKESLVFIFFPGFCFSVTSLILGSYCCAYFISFKKKL